MSWNGGQADPEAPEFPWEFVQIGNCGAPIELDEGWLLLTHGVGPVRKYSIGAVLLDKNDPSIVLARSHEPLRAAAALRTRGLCPERRLHLRSAAARRGDRPALRRLRHLLELRDDPDRSAHAQPDGVGVARTKGWRGPATSKPSAPMLAAVCVFHSRPTTLPGIGALRPGSRRSMSPDIPKIML